MKEYFARLQQAFRELGDETDRSNRRALTVLSWVFFALLAAGVLCTALSGNGTGYLCFLLPCAQLLFCAWMSFSRATPSHRQAVAECVLGGWLALAGALAAFFYGTCGTVLFPLFFLLLATALSLPWQAFCLLFLPPFLLFSVLLTRAEGWLSALSLLLPLLTLTLAGAGVTLARRVREEEALARARHLAERDCLTGVYNRRAFRTHFRPVADEGNFALAVLDLDRFKEINDHAGHAAGDTALTAFCRFTESFFADAGYAPVFARLGGDEFVLLFPRVDREDRLLGVMNAYCGVLQKNEGRAIPVPCSCSIGMVFSALPAKEPARILDAADAELYRAKRHNGACVCSVRI